MNVGYLRAGAVTAILIMLVEFVIQHPVIRHLVSVALVLLWMMALVVILAKLADSQLEVSKSE